MKFSDLPIRWKGLLIVTIPVIAMVVAVASMDYMDMQQRQAQDWVSHTYEVRSTLNQVFTLLLDAESGVRGFALTGNQTWLEPYEGSVRALPGVLDHLRELVKDNPVEEERVARLRALAQARMKALETLRAARAGRVDLDQALRASQLSMQAVNRVLDAMLNEEQQLLARRTATLQTTVRLNQVVSASAILAGLLGGLLAAFLNGRSIVRRVEALGENARRLAARRPLIPVPPGRDEIGALDGVLRETDVLLAQREEELRRTQSFLEHLVESSPAVIFQQDARNLVIYYVTPNVERLLGYSVSDIVGVPNFWMEHTHPDDRERVMAQDEAAFAERAPFLETEYRFQRKDGEYRWLYSYLTIEYDQEGKAVNFLGHRLDITARKTVEQALQEREARLDAANKELEAFSYSVSHDLRSPLRSIDGFSQALLEDYTGKLDSTGQEYLNRVRAATQRMGLLIDDLLNLSRITRAPMRRERVDLSRIAQEVAQELRQTQPERNVHFNIRPGLIDYADPGLIRVVLQNLLGNAWKFTSRHSVGHIEFGREDHTYFVRDDGAGFDEQYVSKLFGAFQRLHPATDYSGTGIGLATVQRVVHRHGGRVWANGAVEKGATFFFTIHGSAD